MRNEAHRGKEKRPHYAEGKTSESEPDPIDEENFPDSPARRSADREMAEPTNIPGVAPTRMRHSSGEAEDEDG